ncbi:hypothetical protein E4T47_04400 [Aureobasidium subglaciale]|nr:hypothetical protein E4T47_04400 [Aureobasidium subglaciale]
MTVRARNGVSWCSKRHEQRTDIIAFKMGLCTFYTARAESHHRNSRLSPISLHLRIASLVTLGIAGCRLQHLSSGQGMVNR